MFSGMFKKSPKLLREKSQVSSSGASFLLVVDKCMIFNFTLHFIDCSRMICLDPASCQPAVKTSLRAGLRSVVLKLVA